MTIDAGILYRGFRITSRKVPYWRGQTSTGHTEWSGKTVKGWYSRHPITAGTLAAVKRQIDKSLEGKR